MEDRRDEYFDDLLDRAAETLRQAPVPQGPPPEAVARVLQVILKADVVPLTTIERLRKMKRIAKIAVAASLLAAIGLLISWFMIGGGSTSIAFAEVAKALDNLRTATYDVTMEGKNPMDGKTITTTMKGFFLAPSRERIEMSMSMASAKDKGSSIMILDHQAMKGLVLAPEQKLATTMDLSKIKKPAGPSNPFEMVRQLVWEGSSSAGEKIESLGKKEIDGRGAVGFRAHSNMADQTFWADPQTARLVRIDFDMSGAGGHGVMSNFRYDTELDPSLFSLEPPAGYTVNNMQATMPVEDDLVNSLRKVAEHNNGVFPAAIGYSKEWQEAMGEAAKAEMTPIMADMEKIKKKYGASPEGMKAGMELFIEKMFGKEAVPELAPVLDEMEKIRNKYGKDSPEGRKASMDLWMKSIQKYMIPLTQKLTQKYTQGRMFYNMLKSENDSHYAGGGVKLGTPDRPIFWYKPTGAEKYRVIYADLSVKDLAPDDLEKLPEAKPAP